MLVLVAVATVALWPQGGATASSVGAQRLALEPALGPANAEVTIVEHADFGCPACRAWHHAGIRERIMEAYGDRIRFEWRDFAVITPWSQGAAEAGQCALDQGQDAFWAFHDLAYARGDIRIDALLSYATALPLDAAEFETCLRSGRHQATVQRDIEEARNSVRLQAASTRGSELSTMPQFKTPLDVHVPSVTADQMAELDRIAVEDFSLGLLQMMENAGHRLARTTLEMSEPSPKKVTVLAGGGGNGGGGLAAARERAQTALSEASLAIDALVGYGLRGAARGAAAELIRTCNRYARRILSLDVPTGLDATTGSSDGDVIRPNRILTLALPKTGLSDPDVDLSELFLADIGIPRAAFDRLDIEFTWPFGHGDIVRLHCMDAKSRRCRDKPRGG